MRTVESSARAGQIQTREDVLRQVTHSFIAKSEGLRPEEELAFDQLFLTLTDGADSNARKELAIALAPTPNAPRGVVSRLARDEDITVAAPVLELSARLHEDLLIELASQRGNKHLVALAKRENLSEVVTIQLVQRGSAQVIAELLRNKSATISSQALGIVAAKAESERSILPEACVRSEMPSAYCERLLAINLKSVCDEVDVDLGNPDLLGVEIVALVVSSIGRPELDQISKRFIDHSIDYIEWRASMKHLGERDIARWLSRGLLEDAIVGIAFLSDMPVKHAARLYCAESMIPMAVLLKGLDFSWEVAKIILKNVAHRNDNLDELVRVYDFYMCVSSEVSKRIVRHAALCQKILVFPS
jgi:hypothetical protein